MQVEKATTEIIPAWEELAREVEPLFGQRMVGEKEFSEFVIRKITQQEAFIIRDHDNTGDLQGLIAVSRNNNAISWFAVSEKYRGRGIGSMLLAYAINNMDKNREISVITFKEDDEGGLPARRLYMKFGFRDFDRDFVHDGFHRCLMKRAPEIQ